MKLTKVTITGADDSIDPVELFKLSAKYPFVEWGILVSSKHTRESSRRALHSTGLIDGSRFPSNQWIESLTNLYKDQPFGINRRDPLPNFSCHICGVWVRDICRGTWNDFNGSTANFLPIMNRIQLNFHAETHEVDPHAFVKNLKFYGKNVQTIFQYDNVNHGLYSLAEKEGIDAVALFDTSGGAGILRESWPPPVGKFCGYAGGLSPDNVAAEIEKMQKASIAPVIEQRSMWIDVERNVRSIDDKQFDLAKVEQFLINAKPYVTE